MNLGSLFSNLGGHKRVTIVKKQSWRAAKPVFYHLTTI